MFFTLARVRILMYPWPMSSEERSVPALLKAWMGERKQSEAAEVLDVSQQTVSRLLAGGDASLKLRLKLRRICGISLDVWPTEAEITEADLVGSVVESHGSAAE
jgi:hypothetical protein